MSPLTSTRTYQQALDDLDHEPRTECLRFLCKFCSHHALLPKSLAIRPSFDSKGLPLYSGGFGDVWKGIFHDREVAIKLLKVYQRNQEEIKRVGD